MVPTGISVAGIVLSFFIGQRTLDRSPSQIVWAIGATWVASFLSLPLVLYSQRNPHLRFLAGGMIRSWLLLSALYFGILLGICPWLRDPIQLMWMIFPLLMSTGVSLLVYGPLHDRVLRRCSR